MKASLPFPRFLRFLIIGGLAFTVHFLFVKQCVGFWNIHPLLANVLAFCLAFQVSYWGHYKWTFEASHLPYKETLFRFLVVACTGFLLNETLYAMLLQMTALSYDISLVLVLIITAVLTFVFSKFWAFR